MFTGIVTATGTVSRARMGDGILKLEIDNQSTARELKKGDSVAVNGTCLTAVGTSRRRFQAEVVEETLARTTLGELKKGSVVNLELATKPTDRLGGHLVQGHVDGTAKAIRIEDADGSSRMWWEASDDILRYVVGKGSIALNGVSLTVADAGRTRFEVAIIPHTLQQTTLGKVKVGDRANIEVDLIAKYVEKLSAGFRREEERN